MNPGFNTFDGNPIYFNKDLPYDDKFNFKDFPLLKVGSHWILEFNGIELMRIHRYIVWFLLKEGILWKEDDERWYDLKTFLPLYFNGKI